MLDSDYSGENCSVARTLEVVGERWTLLIVRELLTQPCRFAEMQRKLDIAKNVLAVRLAKLVELRIVEKRLSTPARNWNDYRLTPKGADLLPVLTALMVWGDRYAAPKGPPLILQHECGHPAGHRVVCAYCGDDITLRKIKFVDGPGATAVTSRDISPSVGRAAV